MATATPDDWMERYEQQQLPMEPQDKTSVQPPPSTPQADVASASAAGDHEEAIVNEIVKKVWPQGIEVRFICSFFPQRLSKTKKSSHVPN
jgi:hypothetical protein